MVLEGYGPQGKGCNSDDVGTHPTFAKYQPWGPEHEAPHLPLGTHLLVSWEVIEDER